MKLSKGLRSLLITFINESVVVASWGLTDIQIMSYKLVFKVDGLLYKGEIEIEENGSLYHVRMSDCKLSSSLENIVEILDAKIEKSANYTSDLIDWIINQ